MNRIVKLALVVLLGCLLLVIRGFEDSLFYDPFLSFFRSIENDKALPEFDSLKLIGNVALRFLMNTAVSLGIIWIVFRNSEIVKLSMILYGILFVILLVAFYFLASSEASGQHMALFYLRRFLIQPLLLLVLVPAFYFQKKK
jgi:exosortase F-associated protein